eukprot:767060-Hanusia_phi.AAC.1
MFPFSVGSGTSNTLRMLSSSRGGGGKTGKRGGDRWKSKGGGPGGWRGNKIPGGSKQLEHVRGGELIRLHHPLGLDSLLVGLAHEHLSEADASQVVVQDLQPPLVDLREDFARPDHVGYGRMLAVGAQLLACDAQSPPGSGQGRERGGAGEQALPSAKSSRLNAILLAIRSAAYCVRPSMLGTSSLVRRMGAMAKVAMEGAISGKRSSTLSRSSLVSMKSWQ